MARARRRFVEMTEALQVNPDMVETMQVVNLGGQKVVRLNMMSGDAHTLPSRLTMAEVLRRLEGE